MQETLLAMQDELVVVTGLQRQLAHSEQALAEARRSSAEVQLPHSSAVLQTSQAHFSWHPCIQDTSNRGSEASSIALAWWDCFAGCQAEQSRVAGHQGPK